MELGYAYMVKLTQALEDLEQECRDVAVTDWPAVTEVPREFCRNRVLLPYNSSLTAWNAQATVSSTSSAWTWWLTQCGGTPWQ